ncbi:hypothetical protein ACFSGX_07795 [Sphingomonas arantia]|uniref:Chemotaxis protein n=1 Tax=Sphingomonas arantia TaxID=1460676 RepID=A0ABW4TY73_9SPHN
MAATSPTPAACASETTQIAFERLDSGQATLERAGVMFRAAETLVSIVRDALRQDGDAAFVVAAACRELSDAICLIEEGADRLEAAAQDVRAADTRTGGSF